MILLDTHTLIWLDTADRRLGRKTRALIEKQWAENKVAVSAISFWEAGMLTERGRFRPAVPVAEWRVRWLDAGLLEFPLDGAILIRALDRDALPKDPADRFIVATALAEQAKLVTADEKILAWQHAMARHDAKT
ncbi:MAG: PIN domain-containing protein [Betaproteobacteria bacterium]|nr:PIN domain-containing protein [Betaproteobacteria bacterium]